MIRFDELFCTTGLQFSDALKWRMSASATLLFLCLWQGPVDADSKTRIGILFQGLL